MSPVGSHFKWIAAFLITLILGRTARGHGGKKNWISYWPLSQSDMFVPSTDVEKNDTVHYIDLIRSPILRWGGGGGGAYNWRSCESCINKNVMKMPLSNSQTASLVLAKAASWSQPLRHARMWCGGRVVARAFVAICVVTVSTHKTPCFLLWPCHVNSISTFKTWLTDCLVIWLRVLRPDKSLLGVHPTETCGLWVE